MENNLMKALDKQTRTIDDIKNFCAKELFDGKNIMNINPTEVRLAQLTLRLINDSLEVNVEMAKVLEGISTNLELVLAEEMKES